MSKRWGCWLDEFEAMKKVTDAAEKLRDARYGDIFSSGDLGIGDEVAFMYGDLNAAVDELRAYRARKVTDDDDT